MLFVLAPIQLFGQLPDYAGSPPAEEIRKIQETLRKNPPQRFKEIVARRQAARRELQRRGYTNLLYYGLQGDALSALISYVKLEVQAQLSLSHGFLFWIIPPDPIFNRPGLSFEEENTFAADPWEEG